jgi:hypothetical protein
LSKNEVQLRNTLLQMLDRSQHCASLLSMIFFRIGIVIPKFRFTRGFGKTTFHCVEQTPLQMANLDILLCVWIWMWYLLCVLNKITIGWVISYFPPCNGNGDGQFSRTNYTCCEKPHTCYTTNIRGQNVSLSPYLRPK